MSEPPITWVPDRHGILRARIAAACGMSMPVECLSCGNVHDAAKVTVTATYADCSMWNCPGCGRQRDDRPAGMGGIPTTPQGGVMGYDDDLIRPDQDRIAAADAEMAAFEAWAEVNLPGLDFDDDEAVDAALAGPWAEHVAEMDAAAEREIDEALAAQEAAMHAEPHWRSTRSLLR